MLIALFAMTTTASAEVFITIVKSEQQMYVDTQQNRLSGKFLQHEMDMLHQLAILSLILLSLCIIHASMIMRQCQTLFSFMVDMPFMLHMM